MISCKKCGYEGDYLGPECPECHEKIELSENEKNELLYEITLAKDAGEYDTVVENYRILADLGYTEAEREYAKILEKGSICQRDIDGAMEFFYRAAKKCDPYSAYKYSRLVSRISDSTGRFWLLFSAVLGCRDAYFQAAEIYADEGKDDFANYYYYLAAMGDDIDAIVKLASRYFNGTGIEENREYAKWYMDKLTFPPIFSLKLAYKLRGVKAKEAPVIYARGEEMMLRSLIAGAKKLGFDSAVVYLLSALSDKGNKDALFELGDMYLSGEGTEKNPTEAIRILTRAAASGSSSAYLKLGGIYRDGEVTRKNYKLALSYFEKAADLGRAEGYEEMGDIFSDKDFEEHSIAYAEELYSRGAAAGISTAADKAESIRSSRLAYYHTGAKLEQADPEEALRSYTLATEMGYLPARVKLAECYALGIGTKPDRRLAFLWYKNAADAGCEAAYFPLGICYSRGMGIAFNYKLAVKYLTMAKSADEKRADREIRRLYENKRRHYAVKLYSTAMRLIYMKKYEPSAKYLELAARIGNPKALYTLGCLYEFGRGVEQEKVRAYELYAEAGERNFSDPREKYKLSVLKMINRSN